MNRERVNEIYQDYEKAVQRLKEALDKDSSEDSVYVDGTIQRFEFTFELAWKLAKAILGYQGIEAPAPRTAIKEAFRTKLIADGDGWIDMLGDRNKTAHLYDESEAVKIYNKIKEKHFKLLLDFKNDFEKIKF